MRQFNKVEIGRLKRAMTNFIKDNKNVPTAQKLLPKYLGESKDSRLVFTVSSPRYRQLAYAFAVRASHGNFVLQTIDTHLHATSSLTEEGDEVQTSNSIYPLVKTCLLYTSPSPRD